MRIQLLLSLLLVPISSIFLGSLVSCQCVKHQQALLLEFRNELSYDSSVSVKVSGWNQSVDDCCSWGGVTCDDAGHVIGLDLHNETLSGEINESSSLFGLRFLESLNLAYNSFDPAPLPSGFGNLTHLNSIDLSSNRFQGEIPAFIFTLPAISTLALSGNEFSGNVDLDMFETFKELSALELSYNNLTVYISANKSSSLTKLNTLKLASCKMKQIPDLKNQSSLAMLDLSDNELGGEIPNWIWEVGNGYLRFLNLSHNKFSSLQKPYTFPFVLDVLDLHSNNLKGDIPIPPRRVYILDYSNNNFGTSIPHQFGNVLRSTLFFSISSSKVIGVIPQSICNATSLSVLDLSDNSLSGTIPSCLADTTRSLRVLDLGRNNLTGSVLDGFPESCNLQTLDLNGNHLQGPFPPSLMNCKNLGVLNLGDNLIKDGFPCWMSNLTNLHVFVIRSNRFYGNITCLESNSNWPNLHIIDIASNGFSGFLPPRLFASFYAIVDKFENQSTVSHLHFVHPAVSAIYYQDSTSVVLKGQTTELVKILNIFTTIDFSDNSFQGNIPDTVGDLKLLRLLNLSHNSLTGQVPISTGKLANLESYDLSVNRISGSIPTQLADISFLSLLNLSYNQLSGRIPRGSQFQTFTELSYMGNKGLCGLPLKKSCDSPSTEIPRKSPEGNDDDDDGSGLYVSIGLGFVVGFAIIVGPLLLFQRWRTWYNSYVERILLRVTKAKEGMIIKNIHEESTFF